jgi:hypothetical protein
MIRFIAAPSSETGPRRPAFALFGHQLIAAADVVFTGFSPCPAARL